MIRRVKLAHFLMWWDPGSVTPRQIGALGCSVLTSNILGTGSGSVPALISEAALDGPRPCTTQGQGQQLICIWMTSKGGGQDLLSDSYPALFLHRLQTKSFFIPLAGLPKGEFPESFMEKTPQLARPGGLAGTCSVWAGSVTGNIQVGRCRASSALSLRQPQGLGSLPPRTPLMCRRP